MELEDIFKAAEEITGKPMRLVALLQHPWNPFGVPLQQCEMMSVKMGCHASPPAIYLIYSGISVKNKWCYSKILQDLSQRAKAHEGNNVVSSTERGVGVSSSVSVSVLCKASLRDQTAFSKC